MKDKEKQIINFLEQEIKNTDIRIDILKYESRLNYEYGRRDMATSIINLIYTLNEKEFTNDSKTK